LLPTEFDLSDRFDVSRHTVREAISHLQSLGLVQRVQGRGTVVSSAQVARRFKLSIRSFSDVENQGYFTNLHVMRDEMIDADPVLAQELGCEPGRRFLHVVSKRVPIDETIPLPIAWNESFIVERYAGIRQVFSREKGPVYSALERMFGFRVVAIEQDVRAVELTDIVAKALSVRRKSRGLQIKRTYLDGDGNIVLIGFNVYAGDGFTLNMRFEQN
jgi:DNA-binding GntR family transcriptional regulator